MTKRLPILAVLLIGIVAAAGASGAGSKTKPKILFDDFSYDSRTELSSNGWIVREQKGWPGVPGASFDADGVSFLADPASAQNRLMRMTVETAGKPENTTNVQICHQRKFRLGTSAARVRFRDDPTSGVDGDQLVQTFYQITPYRQPLDPKYSEMDFEYLPNGGWGTGSNPIFFTTTWEKVQIEPWLADNKSKWQPGSLDGWHTLIVQVDGKKKTVTYFLDGRVFSRHGGKYFPESPMSLNFNEWWINDGFKAGATGKRVYQEDVDWVFHQTNSILTPRQVAAQVLKLRKAGTAFTDSVPAAKPKLTSPCDL